MHVTQTSPEVQVRNSCSLLLRSTLACLTRFSIVLAPSRDRQRTVSHHKGLTAYASHCPAVMSHVAALHRSRSVCNRPVMQPLRPAAPTAAPRARVVPAAFPAQRRPSQKSRLHAVRVRAVGTQAPPFGGQQTASGRSQQHPMQRVQQLFDLLREIGSAAAESGPTGFTRCMQLH